MNAVDRYKKLLADVFVARAAGDEAAEDDFLDEMDRLWHDMGDAGRAEVNSLSERIASGELSETEYVREIGSKSRVPQCDP